MLIHPTANINPETGIAFGYVAAHDLDQDLVMQLLDEGKNETLADWQYFEAAELLKDSLLGWNDVEFPPPSKEDYDKLYELLEEGDMDKLYELLEELELTDDFEESMESLDLQEPHIHGECEGVKYSTSWLGGALNFFIIESPIITKTACKASPCVPNAGILKHPEEYDEGEVEAYGIPEDWWDTTERQNCQTKQQPMKHDYTGDKMKQISLSHAIAGEYQLSEEDIDDIVQLLTSRCNDRTKWAVRTALTFIQNEPVHAIHERVIKNPKGGWQYVAGQSYPDEIRTVRSLLRGW